MNIAENLLCPKCSNKKFTAKREVTYVYTYGVNTPNTNEASKDDDSLPFLFDNREKIKGLEYLQCDHCGTKYYCSFSQDKIDLTILQKAIRCDYKNTPEFLG